MATALSMITRAMRLAGVIGTGETPSDDEAADGLTALNSMLDSWQSERLFVYQIRSEQFTWTALQQSQTVGSGGDFNTDLPTRVADDCSFTIGSIDYPVKLINIDAWTNIPDKTTQSTWPWWIYVQYAPDLVTLYAYPIPNSNVTFNLRTTKRLQTFSALTTALSLPPGNERAITYSLAEEYAPEYGVEVPPRVSAIARAARRVLKINNAPRPISAVEPGWMTRRYTAWVKGDIT